MKIGVITYSNSKENYGQLLQCYAMQQCLKELCHSPYLIRYIPDSPKEASFRISNLLNYVIHFPRYVSFVLNRKKEQRQQAKANQKSEQNDRHFVEFLKENITLSEIYDSHSILTNPPIADAYICGSDQIWGNDDAFFLNFAQKEKMKIAYAPSFGGSTNFSEEYKTKIKHYLSEFCFIGVREQTGVDFCHSIGYNNAIKVVDPTLLLEKDDYNRIATKTDKKNYIFVYLLGNPTLCTIDEIQDYAKSVGKEVVYVASQGRYDCYQKTYPTINEWLGYVASSDLIITNSFHCVVFALIFQKNFIALPLNKGFERMNCRIEELLAESNLKNRIWKHNLNEIGSQTCDFSFFKKYHIQERHKSLSILKRLLTENNTKQ